MNPLHPGVPRVTWGRLGLVFSAGFLFWVLLGWQASVGLAGLFLGGIVIVLAAGAALFLGMRKKENE